MFSRILYWWIVIITIVIVVWGLIWFGNKMQLHEQTKQSCKCECQQEVTAPQEVDLNVMARGE